MPHTHRFKDAYYRGLAVGRRIRAAKGIARVSTLTVLLLLTACSSDKEQGPREEVIRAVKAEVAQIQPARLMRRFPSVLEPPEIVPLAFEVGGRVAAVDLKVGQQVSAGELLATIEPEDLDLRLSQARAALAEATTAAANAKSEARRHVELFKRGVTSAVVRDRQVALSEQAEARRAQAQTNVELLREIRGDAELRAPFDGVINSVEVQDFTSVKNGEPVLTLYQEGDLQALILVSYDVAESLEIGRAVRVIPSDGGLGPLSAVVTEIGRRAPAVSSFPVIVTLPDAAATLRSGMAVEVEIGVETAGAVDQIALPLSAIATNQPVDFSGKPPFGAQVFVFKPDESGVGQLESRSVSLVAAVADRVFVSEGLDAGEIIVTAGVPFVREGQKVQLWRQIDSAKSGVTP